MQDSKAFRSFAQNKFIMNAEEPTAAYYTPSMVHALQRSIANRITHETNPEKLSEISRILDASSEKESFEARYQKAKEFAYKHFDKEYIQSLEARNFLVDEPFPLRNYTDEEWEKELERAEEAGDATDEEVAKMYSIWEDGE